MKKKFLLTTLTGIMVASMLSGCGTVAENTNRDITLKKLSTSSEATKDGDNNKKKNETKKKKEISIVNSSYDMSQGVIPKIYIEDNSEITMDGYSDATIRVVDESGQYEGIDSDSAKIKVRGHSSALGVKKPYNIKFEDKQNLLGMGSSKKWSLLANLFDPTGMRNELAFEFARNIGMEYTSNTQYVEVYLNGEYQGLYLLAEPVEEGTDKVDIDVDNNDYLLEIAPSMDYSEDTTFVTSKGYLLTVKEGKDEDLTYITNLVNNFENSLGKSYEEISEFADMDSFVDYYVYSELFKDVDFATSSGFFYVKDDVLCAGPVWDYDLSMGNVGSRYTGYSDEEDSGDSTKGLFCQQFWFKSLSENEEFMEKVEERFEELQPLIENFTTDNDFGKNRIDNILENYGSFMNENVAKWPVNTEYAAANTQRIPDASYEENVEFLRQWLIKRNQWLKEQWCDD